MAKAPPPQPLDPNDLETPHHSSIPSLPIPDAVKIRCGDLAEELEVAERDGYAEANLMVRLLELVGELAPIVLSKL